MECTAVLVGAVATSVQAPAAGSGGRVRAEEPEHAVRSAERGCQQPRPSGPARLRRKRPHTDQRQHQHHLLEQVSKARKAMSTPFTRVAEAGGGSRRALRLRARVPAGGSDSTVAAAPLRCRRRRARPMPQCDRRPRNDARLGCPHPRRRAEQQQAVRPLPIATSVERHSTACNCIQTIASSSRSSRTRRRRVTVAGCHVLQARGLVSTTSKRTSSS